MLKLGKSAPFEEDIEKATSENNLTEDWTVILLICDNVINYQDGAKFCLKAILKRLHHNVPRVVLQTLTLLDACVKNCDRRFLLQVASSEFTTEARKLLAKMHPSAADKLKELLQRWSSEQFKDDPELCIIPSLYYKLKSEGVEFPTLEKEKKSVPICTDPDAVSSQEEENDIIKALEISLKDTGRYYPPASEYGSSDSGGHNASEPFKSFKVRAIYDFEAAEDNELTIKSGEIVLVLDNSNTSWWKGSNHRGEGLFPANFVTDDLDFKAEDLAVETQSAVETVPDTSFVGEVKLNEEKIETVLTWLNDTDPAGESPDPEDMLRLEDEVYKMGPLIEEKLESIDKRLAMLNLVNEKIMSAFDTFHSLSDNWASMQTTMKYPVKNYTPVGVHAPQPQVAATSVMHPNMQTLPPQHMMYYPIPTPGPQPVANDPRNNASGSIPQAEVLPQQMNNLPGSMPQSSASDNSSNSSIVTNPVVTSANQVGHPPMMMNPYNPPVGGFYVPQGVPFPFQYPPNPANMQQQGFIQTPGSTPNFMNIPQFSMPATGPYIPFPYYYMNSASPAPMNTPVSSANPNQESTKLSSNTTTTELNTAPSVSTYPAYSNDLNSVTLSGSNTAFQEKIEKHELSTDASNQSSGDVHVESVHVSNQM